MAKKASKKKAAKKKAAAKAANLEKAFFDAVHPVVAGGYTEPMASQHTRTAWRRFKENME